MTNVINSSPYLRTSREFPEEIKDLCQELSKSYLDTANSVNTRTIGLFPTTRPAISGETWYLQGNRKQQGLRQVYIFSDASLTIPHGLNFSSITNFTRIWGTFFDGTNYQTLPYVDVTSVNNQITVEVNATNIVITKGGGSPPSISNGLLVLEYLSNP